MNLTIYAMRRANDTRVKMYRYSVILSSVAAKAMTAVTVQREVSVASRRFVMYFLLSNVQKA